MLGEKKLNEIREHLESCGNPIFFYDNDCDGLCSFLILRRWLGKGYGVAIRSYPELKKEYARKVSELGGDCVFILDKPVISRGFLEDVEKLGLKIVIIDHHSDSLGIGKENENVFLYNSYNKKKGIGEPVSFVCYKTSNRKENEWLGVIGCIADHYLPDFGKEFAGNAKEPFDVLYKTEIGKVARALNFGLKDSASNIVKLQNFLISSKGYEDVFVESEKNKEFRKKYFELKRKYGELIEKAKENVSGKVLFFSYSGSVSMSADLANELCYLNKDKYIIVAYKNQGIVNISGRGKAIKEIFLKVAEKMCGKIQGGGHRDAIGAKMSLDDLDEFKGLFERELEKIKKGN